MKRYSKLILALTLAIAASSFAGCKSGSKDKDTTGKAGTSSETKDKTVKVDPTKVTGTVNFGVYNWGVTDYTELVAKFNAIYPNVTVNLIGFDGALNDFLTTQASAGTLPDVVFGWDNLNYPISQGWVAPIDEYFSKDPDSKYVDSKLMESYKFGGKTYAVPTNLQFSSVLVNLDLVEQLNMDVPSYEWTIDEFKEYLTKATTDKISGINHLWDFDDPMTGMMSKTLSQRGMDPATGKFNLTDGSWVKAISLHKELKAVPGLVSDDLKNQALRDEGKEDDYMKKFGKDADALRESKVLMGFHGTWDLSWIKTMNYKYDFYPLPQDPSVGYREAMHADHAFMLSTAKAPQASYEFLKWISFGTEGTLARLDYDKNKVDADGNPAPDFRIPSSSHPDVKKAFEALDIVPAGIKYMYNHQDKAFRADYYKVVPDYNKIIDEIVRPQSDKVRNGEVEAAAVAAEIEKMANDALAESKATFESQLAEVQKK